MSTLIEEIIAREVLDSRGRDFLDVDAITSEHFWTHESAVKKHPNAPRLWFSFVLSVHHISTSYFVLLCRH